MSSRTAALRLLLLLLLLRPPVPLDPKPPPTWARYQRREAAKTVRNYSASDLAGDLGAGPGLHQLLLVGQGPLPGQLLSELRPLAAAAAMMMTMTMTMMTADNEAAGASDQLLRPGTPPGSDPNPAGLSSSSVLLPAGVSIKRWR